jgi:hypothetical protein
VDELILRCATKNVGVVEKSVERCALTVAVRQTDR